MLLPFKWRLSLRRHYSFEIIVHSNLNIQNKLNLNASYYEESDPNFKYSYRDSTRKPLPMSSVQLPSTHLTLPRLSLTLALSMPSLTALRSLIPQSRRLPHGLSLASLSTLTNSRRPSLMPALSVCWFSAFRSQNLLSREFQLQPSVRSLSTLKNSPKL
jgi:hypothetical protein